MKRNSCKLAWSKAFRKAHGKEMTVDSTLSLQALFDVTLRCNRHDIATTLRAMQKVEEIRAKRERVFYKTIMKGYKDRQKLEDARLVAEQSHLLPPALRDVGLYEGDDEKLHVNREEVAELLSVWEKKSALRRGQRLIIGYGPEDMDTC